jgi:hypothetical protein
MFRRLEEPAHDPNITPQFVDVWENPLRDANCPSCLIEGDDDTDCGVEPPTPIPLTNGSTDVVACVQLSDTVAVGEEQAISETEVSYSLSFPVGETYVQVGAYWDVAEGGDGKPTKAMKEELIKVANSFFSDG